MQTSDRPTPEWVVTYERLLLELTEAAIGANDPLGSVSSEEYEDAERALDAHVLSGVQPPESLDGLSVICNTCGTLVAGEEAGDRVRWVTCQKCVGVQPAVEPTREPCNGDWRLWTAIDDALDKAAHPDALHDAFMEGGREARACCGFEHTPSDDHLMHVAGQYAERHGATHESIRASAGVQPTVPAAPEPMHDNTP